MNALSRWILSAALILPLMAEEARIDKPAPPAAADEQAPEKKNAMAFLGVGTAEIPELLIEHLQLTPGEGLMVESVQADSPAAKAGIKVNDIIHRISGKPVASVPDLGIQIRSRKPGEKIQVDVIQKGKPATLDITLAQRPQGLAGDDLEERIKDLNQRVKGLQLQMDNLNFAPNLPPNFQLGGGVNIRGGGELRLGDPEGSIGYKSDGGDTEVTVRDHDNKIVWSGPWNTDQDKAAAPDDIRTRIERLNIKPNVGGNGIQLQLDP